MIEIVALILLSRRIRAVAAAHGRRPREMTALLVACWIGFEVAGMALAVAVDAATPGFYALALVSAGVGAGLAFAVAGRGEPVPSGSALPPPLSDRLAARPRLAVVGAVAAALLCVVHLALVGRARGWWIVAVLVADVVVVSWLASRVRRPGVRADVPARRVGRAVLAIAVPVWSVASLLGALALVFGDRGPDDDVADLAAVIGEVASVRDRFPAATLDPAWRVDVRISRCQARLPLLRAAPEAWRVDMDLATGVDETYEELRPWTTSVGDRLGTSRSAVNRFPGGWSVGQPGSLDRTVWMATDGCVATDEAGAGALATSFRELGARLLAFEPTSTA